MLLPRDLLEMLSAFEKGAVRYLVIGGHAVGLHARPRSTKDLDIWLDDSTRNVKRACVALEGRASHRTHGVKGEEAAGPRMTSTVSCGRRGA